MRFRAAHAGHADERAGTKADQNAQQHARGKRLLEQNAGENRADGRAQRADRHHNGAGLLEANHIGGGGEGPADHGRERQNEAGLGLETASEISQLALPCRDQQRPHGAACIRQRRAESAQHERHGKRSESGVLSVKLGPDAHSHGKGHERGIVAVRDPGHDGGDDAPAPEIARKSVFRLKGGLARHAGCLLHKTLRELLFRTVFRRASAAKFPSRGKSAFPARAENMHLACPSGAFRPWNDEPFHRFAPVRRTERANHEKRTWV